ncbi:MAG: hypothetical protein WC464_08185 [Bdellovibrionales bacterium]
MKQALYISITIVIILGAGLFVYFRFFGTDGIPANTNSNTNASANSNAVACTMEAKLCPDGSAVGRIPPNCEFAPCPDVNSLLTEAEAREIAEQSCIKGGESLSAGVYNENTKTWWYDANLNSTREGCNPACVVNEQMKSAEINWRCTGLIEPE